MHRSCVWLLVVGLFLLACGPDHRQCTGQHADFEVTIEFKARPLPTDTVIHVTYGGSGMEEYSPSEHGVTHEVVFCSPERADAGAAAVEEAGASGAPSADDTEIRALHCQLWTGGYAKLEVRTDGMTPLTYELTPRDRSCTVLQTFVLDSPDAG